MREVSVNAWPCAGTHMDDWLDRKDNGMEVETTWEERMENFA
ncbi:hypothetical protein [Sneathiella marina]|nr:hypothetical protein [Sneathiella marina]